MNEFNLNLTVAVDHDLDNEGFAELLELLKEHLDALYDEPGPQQSYFSCLRLQHDPPESY